jgi:hypothetical protein
MREGCPVRATLFEKSTLLADGHVYHPRGVFGRCVPPACACHVGWHHRTQPASPAAGRFASPWRGSGCSGFSPLQLHPRRTLAVPSFRFRSLPSRCGCYPRHFLLLGVGPPTLCAFRLREPRVSSRDLASPVARTVRPRSIHPPPPPPARPVPTSRPRPPGALPRACQTNRRFPPNQSSSCRERVRYSTVATQDAFDWSEISILHRESPCSHQRVQSIAARLGHPFTHRSRSLRHEFTELPRRADPSPSRRLPAAIAGDVPAPGEMGEDASRQSLQPMLVVKNGHPMSHSTLERRAFTQLSSAAQVLQETAR